MSIKALQDYTYYAKYAIYNKEKKRRETWDEAVDRVKQMHLRKYPQVADQIEWAFEQSRKKIALGSQRALQYGGVPVEKKNARVFNCTASYCDRIAFFQEAFWLLLCGAGVGFSVQKHHIAKLPELYNEKFESSEIFVIPDTIEGWADAAGVLLATRMYHPQFPQWYKKDVVFDYSEIRKKGSRLSSGVGKAPGPEPLFKSLEIIKNLINKLVEKKQTRLRPIDAYDIVMHLSDSVLSGGVRRSSCITIFSVDDVEMTTAKTGNWNVENPQRARSNNSALLLRNFTTKEQFKTLMESVKEFGEPGFFWSDSTEQIPNPCCEIGMYPVDVTTGISGWQVCNLSEVNGKLVKSVKDFEIAVRAAAIIGTLQAGYTSFEYLGEVSERIMKREALLGISITGVMENPDILLNPEYQTAMAKIAIAVNEELAPKIGVNPAARLTCIKPSGTASCVLGTSSGIHPHHARKYFRRVQANALEAPMQYFETINPMAVEDSVWGANKTDKVLTFCCEVPKNARLKNDVSALEFLQIIKSTQQNWVSAGKVAERCTAPWLNHNVSNTVRVNDDEWDSVTNYIYDNRNAFAGISLLPASGDLDYKQAPFVKISTPEEIVEKYGAGALMASGLIVDGLHVYGDLWDACSDVMILHYAKKDWLDCVCNGQPCDEKCCKECTAEDCVLIKQKNDWIRRLRQFAFRYCNNDVKKCCYLLKEVHCWKHWCDLTREYKDVDFTKLIEEEDNTKAMETLACAGGNCDF